MNFDNIFDTTGYYGTRVEMIDEIARLHADMIVLPAYKIHQVKTRQAIHTAPYNRDILKDKETEEVRQTLNFMRALYQDFSGTRESAKHRAQKRKKRNKK